MRPIIGMLVFFLLLSCENKPTDRTVDHQTHFEQSGGKETATYAETIDFYIRLAKEFPEINIQTIGSTDSGRPLHIVTYNHDGDFNFNKIGQNKVIVLINNGIHPGESDGIDATMLLYRDLVTRKIAVPENTVVVTIPIYNVGGALNRNSTTRVNQNGPVSYGFRGNAKNYDLNRDFIKSDTKNAQTFASIFHLVKPDIFIDNHVSNGADYQYTLTHLFTQHDKLGGELGQFLHETMMPSLESSLASAGWEITPYVNVFNRVPESGFTQFIDSPRYSTGYTALWNTLAMMVETHMLKPYQQRVMGTYALMAEVLKFAENHKERIRELRTEALIRHHNWEYYPLSWMADTTKVTQLNFKGYEADTLPSLVTGFPRLKYDRTRPFTRKTPYHNYFIPKDSVKIPQAYIVSKGWNSVISLMSANNIDFRVLEKDTTVVVESYRIAGYQTTDAPFEGHYLHYDTKVVSIMSEKEFTAGDFLIPTDQPGIRYILETLEPAAVDSFFNWNFFDTILQEKEGFSPYVFEEIAAELLASDTVLKKEFGQKKVADTLFSGNWFEQLQWIYQHSEYYEPAHLQYPVYRVPYAETAAKDGN